MKVTLAKALKMKNVLLREISKKNLIMMRNNTYILSNPTVYNTKKELEVRTELVNKLVVVKTAISKANIPVVDKIYRQAELKGAIAVLKGMSTMEGTDRPLFDGDIPTVTKATISQVEMENMISGMEKEIDSIQDELDTFNHNTEFELEISL